MAETDPTRIQFVRVCDCGCNQPTYITRWTHLNRGHIKGQPLPFLSGHRKASKRPKAYIQQGRGRNAMLHRQRAEAALGRLLPLKAVVHHPDEDPWNRHARLVICENRAYHKLLHVRMRIKAAGGNPNTDKICSFCQKPKRLDQFTLCKSPGQYAGRVSTCRDCVTPAKRAWLAGRKAQQLSGN